MRDDDEIIRRYLAGENAAEIGRALGVSPSTVANLCRRRGIPIRGRKEAQRLIAQKIYEARRAWEDAIIADYEAWMKLDDIEAKHGIKVRKMYWILRQRGLEARRVRQQRADRDRWLENLRRNQCQVQNSAA